MANPNDLRILIVANINEQQSTKEINEAIRELEKKVEKLNLQIKIDDSTLTNLKNIVNNLDKVKEAVRQQNKVVEEVIDVYKRLDGTTTTVITSINENGEQIKKVTKNVHDEAKKTLKEQEKATDNYRKTIKLTKEELNEFGKLQKEIEFQDPEGKPFKSTKIYKDGYIATILNFDSEKELTSRKQIIDYAQQEKDELKEQLQLERDLEKIEQKRLETIAKRAQEERKVNENQEKAKQKYAEYAATRFQNAQVVNLDVPLNFNASQEELLNYAKAVAGANAEFTKVIPKVDQFGNRMKEMHVRVLEGGKYWHNYTAILDETTGQLYKVDKGLSDVSARQLGWNEQLKIAISRTITWALATTAIYGTKRALEQALGVIIEIDSQLTQLARVADEGTNIEEMFRGAINTATELGQKITDVNDALIMATQAGYSAQEALDLTRTSVLAANVSDLKPEEAMNDLIGAMTAFNIEAKDSIRIVDVLNETDNNYAVTVRQLADSLSHASSAAETYGASLEQLTGYTTAIAEVTRESGSVIGNMLKSTFSRIYADEAAEALAEIGVQTRDIAGESRKVSDVLSDLAAKWNTLTNAQKQDLAVVIAGRYQLTR